jgi:hypothetical protein
MDGDIRGGVVTQPIPPVQPVWRSKIPAAARNGRKVLETAVLIGSDSHFHA